MFGRVINYVRSLCSARVVWDLGNLSTLKIEASDHAAGRGRYGVKDENSRYLVRNAMIWNHCHFTTTPVLSIGTCMQCEQDTFYQCFWQNS